MCTMLSGLFIGGDDGRPPKPYKEITVSLRNEFHFSEVHGGIRGQFALKSIRTHFGQFVLNVWSIRTHFAKFSHFVLCFIDSYSFWSIRTHSKI